MDFIKTIEVDGVVYEIYDEGARTLMVVKASGLTAGLVYDYIVNASGTTTTCVSPIIAGSGVSSLMQQSLPLTGESAGFRANTVSGNFSGAFGSRITIGEGSSETFAFGGIISATHTQNALLFGYRTTTEACHQSVIGGYRITAQASESAIFGERHTITGTVSYDAEEDSYNTNTRRLLVYGSRHTIGNANYSGTIGEIQDCFIGGYEHTVGNKVRYLFVHGQSNTVGNDCAWVQVFGGSGNILHDHIDDSTVFGYGNELFGGPNGSSKRSLNFVLGCNNTVQSHTDNTKGWNKVIVAGFHLQPRHSSHIVLGWYNAHNSSEDNDVLTVGCGSSSERKNCFSTGIDSSGRYIRVGGTMLYESQLEALKALISSDSSIHY